MEKDMEDLSFEFAHIGINRQDEKEAYNTAGILWDLFGFSQKDLGASIFVSDRFEVMKKVFHGQHGHIAIRTNNIIKAKEYLTSKGIRFNEESAIYDDDGRLVTIYLMDDIAGFAFHLLQKK